MNQGAQHLYTWGGGGGSEPRCSTPLHLGGGGVNQGAQHVKGLHVQGLQVMGLHYSYYYYSSVCI